MKIQLQLHTKFLFKSLYILTYTAFYQKNNTSVCYKCLEIMSAMRRTLKTLFVRYHQFFCGQIIFYVKLN